MKNALLVIVLLALSAVVSFTTVRAVNKPAASAKTESTYERVMRTQMIRCGYVVFSYGIIKDPNTGAMSGLDYEVTETLGRKLNLKIEWVEEVGWGTAISGLNTGRYDAVCNAAWVNPTQGREAYFSRPYLYQPLFVVTRANDTRFDQDMGAIDNPAIQIGSMDGDDPQFIAQEDFPKAHVYNIPAMSGVPMVFEAVSDGKADLTFSDPYEFGDYNAHNQGKLKMTQTANPVRIYPAGYIMPMGDDKFRAMIDTALDEIIYSGQMDKILARYAKYPYSFIPVERPKTLEHIGP